MAEIRQLKADDFEERMALSQFAFQYTIPADQMETRRTRYHPERDFGLFDENGRLLSALALIPFEAWIQGRRAAMGGVAGVASWPDARRQGGVAKLLIHAFETMRSRGQSLSMLHPFSFPFYRKYGYELTIERKHYTLSAKQLPARRETPGAVRIVKKDKELLDPVYQAYASRYDGMLARDEEVWHIMLTKPGIAAAYYDERGEAQGYLLYEVADKVMKVQEWVALTEDARVALWSYAANHDSMIDELKVTVPIDDPLAFLVPDPKFKQEIEPYFMSRIVDAEAFVGQYPFAPADRAEELTIALEDAHAPWNNDVFRLQIAADGSAKLARLEGAAGRADGRGSARGGLRCDIAAFTALLVGGRKASLLREAGRLEGSDEEVQALDRRVPIQRPYLADFF